MAQMARNLTDPFDGFLRTPIRYVLMDRDTKFTAEFQAILKTAGVKPVVLLAKSPNCNAHVERFFRSLKEEALAQVIVFGKAALRNAVDEFPGLHPRLTLLTTRHALTSHKTRCQVANKAE